MNKFIGFYTIQYICIINSIEEFKKTSNNM